MKIVKEKNFRGSSPFQLGSSLTGDALMRDQSAVTMQLPRLQTLYVGLIYRFKTTPAPS